jgi:hypothetical protein
MESSLRWRAAALLFILYLPVFIHFIIEVEAFGMFLYVSVSLMMLLYLFKARAARNSELWKDISFFVTFNILYIAVIVLKLFAVDFNVRGFFSATQGHLISLFMLLYFLKQSKEDIVAVVHRVFKFVGVVFLVQLCLSVYESYVGHFLQYFLAGDAPSGTLDERILLSVISSNIPLLSDLKMPFSGMLGQHNFWGTQLPFYNLIFLYLYLQSKQRKYMVLLALTFVASIFNTSRFGISAILLTDVITLLRFMRARTRVLIIGSLFILIAANLGTLITAWNGYFERADTLTNRVVDYEMYWRYFGDQNPLEMLIGVGATRLGTLSERITGGYGSFESEFFAQLFRSGLIGLVVIGAFLVAVAKKRRQGKPVEGSFGALIVLNVIMVSTVSNLVFTFFVFPFVTLIILYHVVCMRFPDNKIASLFAASSSPVLVVPARST